MYASITASGAISGAPDNTDIPKLLKRFIAFWPMPPVIIVVAPTPFSHFGITPGSC
jgi:hypothetical protein